MYLLNKGKRALFSYVKTNANTIIIIIMRTNVFTIEIVSKFTWNVNFFSRFLYFRVYYVVVNKKYAILSVHTCYITIIQRNFHRYENRNILIIFEQNTFYI